MNKTKHNVIALIAFRSWGNKTKFEGKKKKGNKKSRKLLLSTVFRPIELWKPDGNKNKTIL